MDKTILKVTKEKRNNQLMSRIRFFINLKIDNYDYFFKYNKGNINFRASKICGSINNLK